MYLKNLVRYIHINPVDSFLVKQPEDYRWSSHRAYLGEDAYVWLTKDLVLSRFATSRSEAVERFKLFLHPQTETNMDVKYV